MGIGYIPGGNKHLRRINQVYDRVMLKMLLSENISQIVTESQKGERERERQRQREREKEKERGKERRAGIKRTC